MAFPQVKNLLKHKCIDSITGNINKETNTQNKMAVRSKVAMLDHLPMESLHHCTAGSTDDRIIGLLDYQVSKAL